MSPSGCVLRGIGVDVSCTCVCAGQSTNELLQSMLLSMIGKPSKQWAHVELSKELRELGLSDHHPVEAGWVTLATLRKRPELYF